MTGDSWLTHNQVWATREVQTIRILSLAALLSVVSIAARAQFTVPMAEAPNSAALFRGQCATCHSLNASDPPRQGPNLAGIIGRPVGSVAGYKYTAGYTTARFNWDEAHLDTYLTNPQAMFPDSTMAYRQGNAATRRIIIDYLKDAH